MANWSRCSLTTSSSRVTQSLPPGRLHSKEIIQPSTKHNRDGEESSPRLFSGESQPRPSALRSASTTDTAPRTYPPTCSRLSVTTSAPTPSSSSPNLPMRSTPKASTRTSTGPVGEARSLLRPIMLRVVHSVGMAKGGTAKVERRACLAHIEWFHGATTRCGKAYIA